MASQAGGVDPLQEVGALRPIASDQQAERRAVERETEEGAHQVPGPLDPLETAEGADHEIVTVVSEPPAARFAAPPGGAQAAEVDTRGERPVLLRAADAAPQVLLGAGGGEGHLEAGEAREDALDDEDQGRPGAAVVAVEQVPVRLVDDACRLSRQRGGDPPERSGLRGVQVDHVELLAAQQPHDGHEGAEIADRVRRSAERQDRHQPHPRLSPGAVEQRRRPAGRTAGDRHLAAAPGRAHRLPEGAVG
jgi:hypothetical protein